MDLFQIEPEELGNSLLRAKRQHKQQSASTFELKLIPISK